MAITKVDIDFDTSASNRLFFQCDTDDGATSEWFIGVTGPNGVITAIDLGSPNGTGVSVPILIPNTDPAFVDGGIYEFTVILHPDALPGSAITQTTTFTLVLTASMTYEMSNDSANLTVLDKTTYPTVSSGFTRANTIIYPVVSGVPTSSNFISTGDNTVLSMSLADGNIWQNVTWNVSGTASGTFLTIVLGDTSIGQGPFNITYPQSYTGAESLFVVLVCDPCNIIQCLDTFWQSLWDEACSVGGVLNLSKSDQEKWLSAMSNLTLYNYWCQCDNQIKAREYYDELLKIFGSSCTVSTDPEIVGPSTNDLAWTEFPVAAYGPNFSTWPGDELRYRIYGNVLYFAGKFQTTVWDSSGLTLIEPTFFQGLSLTFESLQFLSLFVDLAATPNLIGAAFTSGTGGITARVDTAEAAITNIGVIGSILLS